MNKIKTTAKIPINQFLGGKGSYGARFQHAKKLNFEFYKQIAPEIKKGMLSPIICRKALKEVLPENIKINIKNLAQSEINRGTKGFIVPLGNTIDGFTMFFPYEKQFGKKNKKAKISSNKLPIIMHETFHLFSGISNPKHLVRCSFNDNEEYKIFENNLYGKTNGKFGVVKILRIMNYLKKQPLQNRINRLQTWRYHLYDEHYAFMEEDKYNRSKYESPTLSFWGQILFLEMLLYKNLQKARKENKLELTKKKN